MVILHKYIFLFVFCSLSSRCLNVAYNCHFLDAMCSCHCLNAMFIYVIAIQTSKLYLIIDNKSNQ